MECFCPLYAKLKMDTHKIKANQKKKQDNVDKQIAIRNNLIFPLIEHVNEHNSNIKSKVINQKGITV